MREPEGRIWHGDHLIDAATPGEVARLSVIEDGSGSDGGLVRRVRELPVTLAGTVTLLGFSMQDPQKAPPSAPLAPLAESTTVAVAEGTAATMTVVSLEPPDGLEDAERMLRELDLRSGVELVTVRWGEPTTWVPAEPLRGAPATTVESAFVLALAPSDLIVPSVTEARGWLSGTAQVPGGRRGQTLRERGHDWSAVPTVGSWDDAAADPWVLGGLLEEVSGRTGEQRGSLLAPVPRVTTLVPEGAPVLVGAAGGGLVQRTNDQLLTLWEGRDAAGRAVALAVHRSSDDVPAIDLPLWPGQRPTDPPDGWCGEVMEYEAEDDPGYVSRYRLRVIPVGRLVFPSRRIVASDPCVAGTSPALGLELPGEGPFTVLRVDVMALMDSGNELDEEARGILVVLDPDEAPVCWEPASDAEGRPIDCGIDTGQLLLGDAEGSGAVERQYDEGTFPHSEARMRLLRSDPAQPADIAVLADLGGDGPAWVVVGSAQDGHPVAVMVANFDPLG